MVIGKKTFADMHVGDKLYFGSLNCSHIMKSTLLSIELLPDEDDCYTIRSNVRFTSVDFGSFEISKCILACNDAVYYEFKGQWLWCGTSEEVIKACVLKALKEQRDLWNNRINSFIENISMQYEQEEL